ncbi:hypothetical protein [Haloglomus litoreum]|uniref:hypothetical protein n=1 Tax=Haloglomus litoreum TaxID=3034026 RepID=UPI0023E8C319|nr:hypothetical protein [Haloglomus sp. DT116]
MLGSDILTASLPALIGTLGGVVVGQLLTASRERRRQAQARERRRQDARTAIAAELASVREYLRDADYDDPDDHPTYPTAAFDSSVASGDFALLDGGTRREISTAYGLVERVREAEDSLVRARAEGNADEFLRRRYGDHKRSLVEHLDGFVEELETAETAADGTAEPTGVVG